MFATKTDTRKRSPAGGERDRSEVATRAKQSAEVNPLWQSLALRPAGIQTKLTIGEPNDPFEHEADQVAERVMRMATPPGVSDKLSFTSVVSLKAQRKCAPCQEEEEKVQRKEAGPSADALGVAPPVVQQALSSPGRPIDASTRAFFEPRFGFNFGHVRIHDDALAVESASAVQALAYTVGQDVVFGKGEYSPETPTGKSLIAHELAHVVQQRPAAPAKQRGPEISEPADSDERAADAALDRVPADEAVRRAATSTPILQRAPGMEVDPLDQIIDFFRRLFSEIGRLLDQIETLPEPLPREALPSPAPRGCRVFADTAALDARKADWMAIVAGMPIADVVRWIIGVNGPPRAALTESDRQRACLMSALAASGHLAAGTSTAPASGYRSFADQSRIWNRKFDFVFHGHLDRRNRFDSITDHARTRCGSLITAADVQWDTESPSHRACWGAPALASTPAGSVPAAPTGGVLSDEEKQREILRASSAPGISRHHFGTDFDFFSVEPVDWAPGGRLFDAYRWLRANATTYGFIQTFTPFSTFMRLGYMEERWHWSYYPIAQALLEFARTHQSDIEANLTSPANWGGAARFNFILAHWREFMFNVEQSP